MEDEQKLTPMFEQYTRIKAEYPDMLLFYRMGDFYELFFEDAVTASKELQITLTSRNRGSGRDIPMCGVPWHAAGSYIAQLIDHGHVVAICEQTENPRTARGLVKRAVTQIITPGTVLDDINLVAGDSNYTGCVACDGTGKTSAFVYADLSTGHWTGTEFHREEELWQWVSKMRLREVLFPPDTPLPREQIFQHTHVVQLQSPLMPVGQAEEILCRVQHVRSLAALGLERTPLLARACATLIRFFEQTQQCSIDQLESFRPLNLSRCMLLDDVTERNLELFTCLDGTRGPGTLRHVLDRTLTPMGGRYLEFMLHHPYREKAPVLRIQRAVLYLHGHDSLRRQIRELLTRFHDMERLTQRISLNRCAPRDLVALRASLERIPPLRDLLSAALAQDPDPVLQEMLDAWDNLEDCSSLLEHSLVENPPTVITDGGLFLPGYSAALDELLDMVGHGEQKLQDLLDREREQTGLQKLRMGYNRVFGYFYELSRAQDRVIPEHFIRRQSLASTERFTTEELKELEEKLLRAADEQKTLEYRLFMELREKVAALRTPLLEMSGRLAELDYWQCLAETGRENEWCLPDLTEEPVLFLEGARHPVVEQMTGRQNFVPNDLTLLPGRSFCLLTGPNMAGKSTILRQTALICLMAQIGSFVPATNARIGLCDRLFSRVGAQDNLARGESTFMVEMMETARILRQATRNSLVILDEIGRGTSTYDGVALAWSIVEYLVQRNSGLTRTIFATHYHELTELEGRLPQVFTMNISIRESRGDIIFLHRLIPGPANRSYGIDVAKLAGIPASVLQRSREILKKLESGRKNMQDLVRKTAEIFLPGMTPRESPRSRGEETGQTGETGTTPPSPLQQALDTLDPEQISPLEALHVLLDWKRRFGKKKKRTGEKGVDKTGQTTDDTHGDTDDREQHF